MLVTILYFARSRELTNTHEEELTVDEGTTVAALWALLLDRHAALSEISSRCLLALNQDYTEPDNQTALKCGDEIAIIPPVSGG